MNPLYPLKFKPILHDKMWGGKKLKTILQKPTLSDKAGESWEISGVDDNISVVSNGKLAGNNLQELIEIFMGDLIGDRIYNKFGIQFPLLIKFIDANDVLSIQVHPDDKLAKTRHNSSGKTEMWYVLQAEQNAEIIIGFNKEINQEEYLKHLNNNTLTEILNTEPAKPGNVFFLPAGRVHAIGAGILLAEIQQTSDITYRIYDFDRRDANGKLRDLHTDMALEAIDYSYHKNYRTEYNVLNNQPVEIVRCPYFVCNLLNLNSLTDRNINILDCFVIYICLDGSCSIIYNDREKVSLITGETVLIPSVIENYFIEPEKQVKLLEVYISSETNITENS